MDAEDRVKLLLSSSKKKEEVDKLSAAAEIRERSDALERGGTEK